MLRSEDDESIATTNDLAPLSDVSVRVVGWVFCCGWESLIADGAEGKWSCVEVNGEQFVGASDIGCMGVEERLEPNN